MKEPLHAIIFDLDGTLLDTITDIANSSNTVLSRWACPTHSVSRYMELVGDGVANMARKVLPDGRSSQSEIDAFVAEYRVEYRERWKETTTHYEGIPELLAGLVAQGIPLAVLSNKRDDFTKLCVSEYFPTIPFKEVRGERTGTPIKPDPAGALELAAACGAQPENCLFVGDSEIDVVTAQRAGMQCLGVLWGFRSKATLLDAGCRLFISSPHELLKLT